MNIKYFSTGAACIALLCAGTYWINIENKTKKELDQTPQVETSTGEKIEQHKIAISDFQNTSESFSIANTLFGQEENSFDIQMNSQMYFQEIQDGAVYLENLFVDASLTAILAVDVDSAPKHDIIYYKLLDITLGIDQENTPEGDESGEQLVQTKLELPFAATLSKDGKIEKIHLSKDEVDFSASFKKSIVSRMQFVKKKPGLTSWKTSEANESGVFKAKYNNNAKTTFKEILEYSELAREQGKSAIHRLRDQSGIREYSFNSEGRIQNVLAATHLLSDVVNMDFHARVESEFEAEWESASNYGIKFLLSSDYITSSLHLNQIFDVASVNTVEKPFDPKNKIDTKLFIEKIAGLSPETQWDQIWEIREQFYNSILHDPGVLAGIENILRGNLDDFHRALILGALTDSELPESQAKMVDIAKDIDTPLATREHALSHMALLKKPTEDTVQYLRGLSDDASVPPSIRQTGILALGSTARNGMALAEQEGADLQVYQDAISQLENGYVNSQTDIERDIYLMGLGNSGGAGSPEMLLALAQSQDPAERQIAVDSLRFHETPEVNATLINTINSDSDLNVQLGAIQSTVFRADNPEIDSVLLNVAGNSENEELRLAALSALEFRAGDSPEYLSILEQASLDDNHSLIQEFSSQALDAKSNVLSEEENPSSAQVIAVNKDNQYTAAFKNNSQAQSEAEPHIFNPDGSSIEDVSPEDKEGE